MKISRGPASSEDDDDYILVDTLCSDEIEKQASYGFLHFSITENAKNKKRASACYINFDKSDLMPLFRGLSAWTDPDHDGLLKIKSVMNKDLNDEQKLKEIQIIISNIRNGNAHISHW